ncbi:c-type cytochrome [soil metagenome]
MRTKILRRCCLLAGLLTIPAALPLIGGQSGARLEPNLPKPVQLSPAETARLAEELRQKVKVEMPPGLELTLWAPEALIVDPIAIDVDPHGTVYVASSSRNNLPLDIRGHPNWFPIVHTLKTVEDLRSFYEKEMAPARSAENAWIPDRNKDGSRDIRDLTEFKERLYRLKDTNGDGRADFSQVMAEGFNADPTWDVAGGVLYHEGDLIFGVPPGIYRLKDTTGDGVIDQQRTISEGYNVHPAFGGHGISGLIMGPDGRLYWEVGDMGFSVVDQEGRRWSYPHEGGVFRSEPDGSGFEVFATGIRNLQEFSFDEHGNLISVDNDGDHQGEHERLVYIPYGSDSGWRSTWQYGKYTDPKNNRYNVWMDEGLFKPRHAGQGAHIIPPVAPYHAGPSGMVYNPGTALSEEWRNHFFVTSFPGAPANARIHAFTLKEDGAGFALDTDKVLLQGILAVGLRFGPEGAMYVTDWVTGWDSNNAGRLWKLDAPAAAGSPMRKEVQALLIEDFASRPLPDVVTLLRHADMRIRQKAQFDIVRRGDPKPLIAVAADPAHRLARLHAMWGIGQLARKDAQHAAHLAALLKDGDAEVRAQAAKVLGDVRHRASGDALIPLLADAAPRVRFFATEALGRMRHTAAAAPIVEMLGENDDRDVYLRHAGSLALSQIAEPSMLEGLAKHPSRGVRLAATVALRRMKHPGVERFLADADEGIAAEAARAINDDGSIVAAVPALARVLGTRPLTNEPFLRRVINANLRAGTTEAANRLGTFAAEAGAPEPMRVEAVAALGVWPSPSPMDRVDGMYHGEPAQQGRDANAARGAIEGLVAAMPTTQHTPAMRAALATAAGRLEVQSAAPVLLELLKSDPAQEVRLASLSALQALNVKNMDEVMQTALADKEPAVRRAALGILPGLRMSDEARVQHLASFVRDGALAEKQGALQVLGSLKSAGSRRLLGTYLGELEAGGIAPELQVDLVDAVQADGSAPLEARLEAYQKSRKADDLVAAFRPALLVGGDARRGQQVATEHPAAECTRCHTLRGRGSDVGPDLTRIGGLLTREQLLEALLEPNARIAPGFGVVSMTLRNGQRVDGTLREETDTHVVVLTGTPPVPQQIAKAEIAERTNPVSAMPPMGLLMKPREIRDIVEYLSTLK